MLAVKRLPCATHTQNTLTNCFTDLSYLINLRYSCSMNTSPPTQQSLFTALRCPKQSYNNNYDWYYSYQVGYQCQVIKIWTVRLLSCCKVSSVAPWTAAAVTVSLSTVSVPAVSISTAAVCLKLSYLVDELLNCKDLWALHGLTSDVIKMAITLLPRCTSPTC